MEQYTIDGYSFSAFNALVSKAEGLDVVPKVKKREQNDWADESGLEIDASTQIVYEAMEIKLSCYVFEKTYADAIKRINGIIALLSGDGFHLLGSTLRKKVYPVLLEEVSSYQVTKTKASEVVVGFDLKLICPLPEIRMGLARVAANQEVKLIIPTGKDALVWWGDGAVDEYMYHTYTNAGTYTVVIAGTGVTSALITWVDTGAIELTIEDYAYSPIT